MNFRHEISSLAPLLLLTGSAFAQQAATAPPSRPPEKSSGQPIASRRAGLVPTRSTAQSCSPRGSWNDDFGYTWTLSPPANGVVTGKVNYHGIPGCTHQVWPIKGSVLSTGQFVATAYNPTPGDSCVDWFGYQMTTTTPTCDAASGTWMETGGYSGSGNWQRNDMPWRPGWDDFNQPLDYTGSFVTFEQGPAADNLHIVYSLLQSVPNTAHLVGIDLYWGPVGVPSTSQCLTNFGQFPASNCAYTCRQNVCRTYNSFELGTITLDANGNGKLALTVDGLAPGSYEAQFYVREPGNDFSEVIYQAPAPYGVGTVFITIAQP